jgi:LuxR family maltose regulon positive regulatory protein
MTFARTKIQPPRLRAAFVERGALQARLAEALRTRRAVLLCAPAGYGKTALLAQEMARLPGGCAAAWVAADAGDDLGRLLECMLAALEPYDPPWRTAPEALAAAASRGAEEQRQAAAEIINTLDACEVAHGVIAFDDLHRVDDPAFFRFLDLLLERMGSRWTVAMTSRTDPPLALARLRAADELAEFRQLQLQFARDEARQLAVSAGLDERLADRLFDRTQGWPAALRIAVGAVQAGGAGGGEARALRASERPLFEFLITEVLGQVPPPLAEFLLAASVLPELDAERCAAVTGDAQAAARLAAVEALGLCVDVLDAPARTLRLHDLVREALLARLAQSDPLRAAALRRRAADAEPDPVRRLGWLLQAGDAAAAARLAFDHLPQLIVTAGPAQALHLIGQFPPEARERSPELAYVRALAHWAQWDFHAMLGQFERAVAGFGQHGDDERGRLARAQRAMAIMAAGRLDEAAAQVARLRGEALSEHARTLVLNAEIWLAIDDCRHAAVAPLLTQMLDLLQRVDRLDLWYQTTPPLRMPGLPGITPVLERHAEQLLRVAGEEPTPLRALGLLSQAWCALWRGRIEHAQALLDSAREDAAWSGQSGAVRAHELTLAAVMAAVRGDARAAVEAATARYHGYSGGAPSGWHRYLLAIFTARVVAACGTDDDLRSALQRVDAERALLGADAAARVGARELPLTAQLAWLEGRAGEAIEQWRQALAEDDAIDMMGQAVETRLRLAAALLARGATAAAIEAAAQVLAPAFARVGIDGAAGGALLAGEPLQRLASVRWAAALPPQQQAQLRAWWYIVAASRASAARAPLPAAGMAAAPPAPKPAGTEALTARELEVLARIAAGDSNKLIARAFDLSLHTVKRHVANILGKVGADSRGQAAAWYRENRK